MDTRLRGQRWLREPLLHFLIGGAAIFMLFAWRGEPVDPADRTIAVDREQQALIALDFERTMQRPPTDAELDKLIEGWVREEVLYRKSLRLGLDQNDPVVRRRLAKKMDFLASSQADLATPSDEELQRWYTANAARFADGARVSFEQRYFSQEADARAGLGNPGSGEPSSLPDAVEGRLLRDVAAQFGNRFVDALAGLKTGQKWQGPVRSGLGWHIVRLTGREAGQVPPLAEVRDKVLAEWRLEQGEARREAAYRTLADAYRIEIAQ